MPFSSISDDSKESKNESVIAGKQKLPKLKGKKEKNIYKLKKAIKQNVKQLNIYIIPVYFKYVYWKPRAHWVFLGGGRKRKREKETKSCSIRPREGKKRKDTNQNQL